MYIWLAIDVEEQLRTFREKVVALTAALGIENPSLTLPLHISLRISFQAPDSLSDEILEKVQTYFHSLKPFSVAVEGLETMRGILWLRVQKSAALDEIHRHLTDLTETEYGIASHLFDADFRYHISLVTGCSEAAAQKACAALQALPIPDFLHARTLVLGTSRTGRAGDYQVTQRISIE